MIERGTKKGKLGTKEKRSIGRSRQEGKRNRERKRKTETERVIKWTQQEKCLHGKGCKEMQNPEIKMEMIDEKREENRKMEEEMKRGWKVEVKHSKLKGSDEGQGGSYFPSYRVAIFKRTRTVGFAPAALLVLL